MSDRPALPLSVLLILGALTAFGPMAIDMYLPSLPTMARELGGTATDAQHTVAVYFAGLALGQLVYGPASDRFGRRPPILLGVALFLAATAGCALAPSLPALIGLRFVQALGGCAGVVVARAVVRDRCSPQQSARVFSTLMLIMGVAPILAPLLGGWVLAFSGWRAIFWVLFAFAAAVGLAVVAALPESRSAETAARARAEHPFRAYATVLGDRSVLGYVLVGGLASCTLFTYIAASAELIIQTYGVPASRFGVIFGLNAAGIIGASQLNRLLLRRHAAHRVLGLALFGALGAASLMLVAALTGWGGMAGVLVPLFFALAVQGLGVPNAMAGALARDPARAGSVSALVGFSQFGLGAAAAGVAGLLHDGSARPMALVVAGCMLAAVAIFVGVVEPARRRAV